MENQRELIEIEVDGLPVPVYKDEYDEDPNKIIGYVRENREILRFTEDNDHEAADRILGN